MEFASHTLAIQPVDENTQQRALLGACVCVCAIIDLNFLSCRDPWWSEPEWERERVNVDLWPPRPAPRFQRPAFPGAFIAARNEQRGRINSSAPERCLCQYSSGRAQGLPSYPLWARNSCRHRVDEMDLAIGLRRIRRSVSTWIQIRDEAWGFLLWKLRRPLSWWCFVSAPCLSLLFALVYFGRNGGQRFAECYTENIRQVPHFQFMCGRLSQNRGIKITIPLTKI